VLRFFAFALMAVSAVGAVRAPHVDAKSKSRPNVILILTDDQGYGDLACHGNNVIKTPNLDQLYSKSIRFTDFHVSPACAPTRAGLMTGRCPNRVGVWHVVMGRCLLHPDEVTMADVFAAGGYKTAIFGKWHLGDNYPFRPHDRGFHEALVHGGGVVGHTPDYWLNDYFDDTYLQNGKPEKVEGYCTDVWFDRAMDFIRANKDRPFFVYLPTNTPHQPFLVPEKYEAMYRDRPDVPNAAFYGMITNIDENVGRLERELKRLGLADDTILIFLTDNGTSAGLRWRRRGEKKGWETTGYNAGMRGKKASQYDGGHRVPFWIHWPDGGLVGGRDVSRLADHVDVLPTLIDLCGLETPEGVRFDGVSLVPLLRGDDSNWPDRTLVAELQLVVDKPVKWRRCAVMTDRWRLVDGRELYNIKADAAQKRDIAAEHPEVVQQLRAEYERWWASVSESHDRVSEIALGTDHENPVKLTAYSWNNASGSQADMPWAHHHIVAGPLQNGFWRVNVQRSGKYVFRLRRWPEESQLAINQTSNADPPEKPCHPLQAGTVRANRAGLKIEDIDTMLPVNQNAQSVDFTVDLKPGSSILQTWFMDADGNSRGAYYVAVERLTQAEAAVR